MPRTTRAPYYNLDGVDVNGNGCTLDPDCARRLRKRRRRPEALPDLRSARHRGWKPNDLRGRRHLDRDIHLPEHPGRPLPDGHQHGRPTRAAPTAAGSRTSGTLQDVQGAYVSDPNNSDPIEYLTLANMTPGLPTTDGNSYPKTPNAQVQVTVAFVPPLKDTPISDPPIKLRFGTGPSQTQALDCNGSGTGPNGWRGLMVSGCPGFQVNSAQRKLRDALPGPGRTASTRRTATSTTRASRTGSRAPARRTTGTVSTTRRPRSPAAVPTRAGFRSSSSTRWRSRFRARRTYPIRRFGGFYVTAGDGMNCPGDDPASGVKRTELWGHFVTYVPNNFGESHSGRRVPLHQRRPVHSVPRRMTVAHRLGCMMCCLVRRSLM